MKIGFRKLVGAAQLALLLATSLGPVWAQQTAQQTDSFVDTIGINIKLRYTNTPYEDYAMVKQMLLAAGIRHVRGGCSPTAPDGMQEIDEENDLAANGIKTDVIFDNSSWSGSNVTQSLISSFGLVAPCMEDAEGPNEPDAGFTFNNKPFPQSAIDFQNVLWAALKSSSYSNTPVIAPSMGNPLNSPAMAGMNFVSNYGNTHSYHGARYPENELQNLGMFDFYIPYAQDESSTLPIMATETGNWVGAATDPTLWMPPITPDAQGKYCLRTYCEYFNDGIVRTYTHELIDESVDPNVAEENFGIIYNNWSPKPAYTGLSNMIAVLADPGTSFTPGALTYSVTGNTSNIDNMLLQRRDGSFYLVLWQAVSSYDFNNLVDIPVSPVPITISFPTAMCQVDQTNPMTSDAPFACNSNVSSITVNVPDEPLIIHIMPVAVLPDLIVTQTGYTGNQTPGAPVTFTATIQNIGSAPTPAGVETAVGFYINGATSPVSWGEIANNAQLMPGETYNITADFSVSMAPGTYTVTAWADDVDRMAETNKNNNKLNQTVTIQ